MLDEILLGSVHVFVTVVIHGMAMLLCTARLRKRMSDTDEVQMWELFLRVFYVVAVMFVATILESAWWAANYVYLGALETFVGAMYFSMVTYTTLGYGDITLDTQWRLLSAF